MNDGTDGLTYVTLRDKPDWKEKAAAWFHGKWGVPEEAYLECMTEYLSGATEYGWYLCADDDEIVGGLGVIENDFHERKDLTPNVCAVYVDGEYRNRGIAGLLLQHACDDMAAMGTDTLYLLTDHTGFYERYGWQFLCMVPGNDGKPSRMYVHHTKPAQYRVH